MKRKRIVELAGVGGQGYIARDRYLKRFILGEMGVKVPFEE